MKVFVFLIFFFCSNLFVEKSFSMSPDILKDPSLERILNTNLYLKKNGVNDRPELLFGYEIENTKVKEKDKYSYFDAGLITVYNFHPKILFGNAPSYTKAQFEKNNDIEITDGEDKFIIKNNGRFEPKSGDLSILSQYKENGTRYYLLHFSGNDSQTNAHYAWVEHSIHLVMINKQNTEISGGYDYTSPSAMTDGDMSIMKDKGHILISEGSSIMYFNTNHPEWGIMVKKINR